MTTTRRALLAVLCIAIFGVSPLAQSPGTSGLASDSEIQKILAERVDTYRQSVGVVVGVGPPGVDRERLAVGGNRRHVDVVERAVVSKRGDDVRARAAEARAQIRTHRDGRDRR